jgi:GntR family transcriptional repressor for pyruvate dehydrogenase complex
MAQREIARPSLSGALTERVLDLIRDEGLRPGDRLPSTRVLSARFAVTTPTLREALRGLQATGVIEIRHGSGIYVGSNLGRMVMPNPNVGELRGSMLLQLLDARLLIEPPLAALAAGRVTARHVSRMEDILAEAGRRLRGDDDRLHEATMAFHRAAASAAGNVVLDEVVDSLLTVHAAEQREILQIFDDRRRDHEQHREILDAIASGEAQAAEALMRSHLRDARAAIQRRQRTTRRYLAREDS